MDETLEKERIGNLTAFLMIGCALLVDGLQFLLAFIPVIGWIIEVFVTLIAGILFFFWFKSLGVNYLQGKQAFWKFLGTVAYLVVEFIPVIDAIPATTAGVAGVVFLTKLEDKGLIDANKATSLQKQKTRQAQRAIYQQQVAAARAEQQAQVAAQQASLPTNEDVA